MKLVLLFVKNCTSEISYWLAWYRHPSLHRTANKGLSQNVDHDDTIDSFPSTKW
jgi:hypothetical protein